MSINKNTEEDVKKENENKKSNSPTTLSEDEQLLIYADIISNFIIKEILKPDEYSN